MNYLSTSYVYITFYGDSFIPIEFTNLIEIKPSRQGIKGEKGEYGSILQESFWDFKIKETNVLELENSMQNLIKLFENKIELIQDFGYAFASLFAQDEFVFLAIIFEDESSLFLAFLDFNDELAS